MKSQFFLKEKFKFTLKSAFTSKSVAVIITLFVAFFMQSFAFAEPIIPEEISSITNVIYETAESGDGRWLFVSAASEKDGKNRLYSFDRKNKQTGILFEPFPDTELRFIYGMTFSDETRKLYFMVHCGEYSANGIGNLFLHEGLYTVKNDENGIYNAKNVWRENALATWILNNLWKAYIAPPPI